MRKIETQMQNAIRNRVNWSSGNTTVFNDNEGNQLGVVEIDEAIRLAKEKDLDLLLVSETADPPVCKINNFGQFKYQQAKKDIYVVNIAVFPLCLLFFP